MKNIFNYIFLHIINMRVEFTRPELAKYIYEMYGELDTIHGLCRAESKGKDMIRYTRSEEYIEFTVHKQENS
jgi:hypothetical protein